MNDQQCKCPNVEAVATVIAQGTRILAVINPRWDGFTLPMSKRKEFRDSPLWAASPSWRTGRSPPAA